MALKIVNDTFKFGYFLVLIVKEAIEFIDLVVEIINLIFEIVNSSG